MQNASNQLYGLQNIGLSPTHYYVKFSPTTHDHLADLEDWEFESQIPIFDFPLDYEIVEAGEEYTDPAATSPEFTFQYASIPVSAGMPQSIPFVVLQDLYLDMSDPILVATSFQMTGHGDEVDEYINGPFGIDPSTISGTGLGHMPIEPILDCPPHMEPALVVDDSSYPFTLVWMCMSTGTGGGEPPINECGCDPQGNYRIAAGCVQVEDASLSLVAARTHTIKLKDSWFFSEFATTDDQGCWKSQEEYKGNMWMSIVFKNSAITVRDLYYRFGLRIFRDFIGIFSSLNYNDIYVAYEDPGSLSHRRYWAASISINVLKEYNSLASSEGILSPRSGLNVLNFQANIASSAPMLQGHPFNSYQALIATIIPPPLLWQVINIATSKMQPDITNPYNKDGNDGPKTYSTTLFHELGHASHHRQVGEGYWYHYRTHIMNHGGYGDFVPNGPSVSYGYVALGEAFGNFIGRRYGATESVQEGAGIDTETNFIPEGLMHDLIDLAPDVILDPTTNQSFSDNIEGFTPAMIFSTMGPDQISIRFFRDRLRELHLSSTPNSATSFDQFVDDYDVYN